MDSVPALIGEQGTRGLKHKHHCLSPAETVASKLRFTTMVDRCSQQFTTLCAGRRSTTDISVAVTDHDAQPFTAYPNDVRGGSRRVAGVVADAPASFVASMD